MVFPVFLGFVDDTHRPRPPRPPARRLLTLWLEMVVLGFLVVNWLDWSFYSRFHLLASDYPDWSFIDALLGPVCWAASAVAGALAIWWSRRRLIATTAGIVFVLAAVGGYAWVQHEAGRAHAGAEVRPSSFLPFKFRALPVDIVATTERVDDDLPDRALLLHADRHSMTIFDPATGQVAWVGNKLATWVGDGSRRV